MEAKDMCGMLRTLVELSGSVQAHCQACTSELLTLLPSSGMALSLL
jgi:hypothetical protein